MKRIYSFRKSLIVLEDWVQHDRKGVTTRRPVLALVTGET